MKRRFRRQPFILLSFSSSKKARKAQETQSYQRFQHIVHTDFNISGTNGPRLLSRVKMGTHSALLKESHTAAYTPKQGAFRMGVVSLLSERSARSRTSPGRVSERQVLPLLGLGRGCSQRTQKACGTAMRLCASLFRGVAAPLGCVIFFAFVEIGICTSGAHGFPRVRGMGGITTLGLFHTFRKPCVAGYQNGVLCRSWALVGCAPKERRKPSGQRCAYARRCPEASRPRWAA